MIMAGVSLDLAVPAFTLTCNNSYHVKDNSACLVHVKEQYVFLPWNMSLYEAG